ncbi:hypothetical protein EVA_17293, partial [gut metagenome]
VTETKPPKGHMPNNHSEPVTVTMPDDKDKTFPVHFEDEPIFCKNKLELKKNSAKGQAIKGVVYKVEFFDAAGPDESKLKKTWYLETDENGIINLDDAHVTRRLQFESDPFYMHKGKIVIPIDGYLQFTEVASPAEYRIDDEPFGMPTGENANLTKQVYNDPEVCTINLKKLQSDGQTPIPGVEFELKFLKAAFPLLPNKAPHFTRLLKEGESIVFS